ncbi:MAG TPA: FHA domain-containing protein, partial [Nannocystaceae bacterium]|nr:FHA domain-containing protein [Nannocystaceae bacterium]
PARATQPPKATTQPPKATTQPPVGRAAQAPAARGTTQPPQRSTTAPPTENTASSKTPVARISPVRVASGNTAPPDPATLQVSPPIARAAISPSDSAAETLEFDVDAELDDAPNPAALSMSEAPRVDARRTQIPLAFDDEEGPETVVDLELDKQDRTVVQKAPPRPPVFDDDAGEASPPAQGTVVARAPSAPAPYRGGEAPIVEATPIAARSGSTAPPRTTVVPTERDRPQQPAPFGGAPPPGSTLVPGTSPDSGGFAAADDPDEDAATVHIDEAVIPPKAERTQVAPIPTAPTPPSPITGLTMPPGSGLTPVSEVVTTAQSPRANDEPRGNRRGRGRKERRPAGVRVIMLGNRGEAVAERTIEVGSSFDLGRDGEQPWSDDAFIEPAHVRLTVGNDSIRVDELVPTGAVFVRVQARARMRDGDQLRVGQSLVAYDRGQGDPQSGRYGRLVLHVPDSPISVLPLGEAGVLIGRELGDVTLPNDTFVSSSHCRIGCDREGIFVEDLDSSNGTYLRIRSGESIATGQSMLVGQTQFVLRAR